MTCPAKTYHQVEFENDHGITGCLCMKKDLYDEDDQLDLSEIVVRVIDAWIRRREFIHNNIEYYKKLC